MHSSKSVDAPTPAPLVLLYDDDDPHSLLSPVNSQLAMHNDLANDRPDNPDPNTQSLAEEQVANQVSHFPSEEKSNIQAGSRWKENHGSFLILFFSIIIVLGFAIIWYQQTRFVPPRFPESQMIQLIDQGTDPETVIQNGETTIGIRIAGAPNDNGTIKVAIHGNVDSFQSENQAFISQSLPLKNGEAVWLLQVDQLPDQFVVAAYHDENNDQELTMNRFGIPSERFGFSREARGIAGPPQFQDAVIERPAPGSLIYVFLR